jgi:Spy/CpxP family protein refolding chaperone
MKRSSRWCLAVAAVAVFSMISTSNLQAQGRRGFGGFGGSAGLLGLEQVQKELDLVKDQIDDIKKIQDESRDALRDMFSGLRDLPSEERRSAFEGLREKMQEQGEIAQKKIDKVLLPHQRDRLKQITFQQSVQRRGTTGVFGSSTVTEALGITDAQQEKLKEKSEEVEKELRKKIEEARQEAIKDLLSVLTPAQRKKYEELMGEPFELNRSQFSFGGRGGDRGGDRGRRGDSGRSPRPGA